MAATEIHPSTTRSERRTRRAQPPTQQQPRFFSVTLWLGLSGALLLWAAFPPLNLPWLAWLAPAPWLWLARLPQLPGRQPYLALWLAGCMHWLLMLEGIRLAHPALYAGWIALALYVAVYLPIFVGLTRISVHRLNMPLLVAGPAIWVGLELLRGHLLTGFSLGLLAHTQAEFPLLIQISDLAGGYALSFVIVLVAACLARMLPLKSPTPDPRPPTPFALWPLLPTAAAIAATLAYGWWRLSETPPGAAGATVHVALIQGSLDTVFVVSPAEHQRRKEQTYEHYRALMARATAQQTDLDLVIWPESMFTDAEELIDEAFVPPKGSRLSLDEVGQRRKELQSAYRGLLAAEATLANANTAANHPGTLLLVGTTTVVYGSQVSPKIYNSALLSDRAGNIVARYYKTHPVMFGEYIPFADAVPLLYRITPMSGGLSVGDGPKLFEVAGLKMSPSVCFESTIPHLIRGQLNELVQRGTPADVLVNITNDGWFWGTGILDLHLRCGVFRAVENRKPLIVAANTGISTWVDGRGVISARGPRRQPQVLLAQVQADGRTSPYQFLGDWPAWLCAASCLGLAGIGWRKQQSTPA